MAPCKYLSWDSMTADLGVRWGRASLERAHVGDGPIDFQISFDIEMSNFISRCPQQLWQVDRQGNASEHRRKLSHRYAKQVAKDHKAMLL